MNDSKYIELVSDSFNSTDSNNVVDQSTVMPITSRNDIKLTIKSSKYFNFQVYNDNFSMANCNNVKTIQYNKRKFVSINNPSDNENAFYAVRNNKCKFEVKISKIKNVKRNILEQDIADLLSRINNLSNVEQLNFFLLKNKFTYFAILFIIITCIILLSYNCLMFTLFTLAIMMNANSESLGLSQVRLIITIFILGLALYVMFYNLKKLRLSKEYKIFAHFFSHKAELTNEIENWNSVVFSKNSMKVELSPNFDYIQFLLNDNIAIDIEEHNLQ